MQLGNCYRNTVLKTKIKTVYQNLTSVYALRGNLLSNVNAVVHTNEANQLFLKEENIAQRLRPLHLPL